MNNLRGIVARRGGLELKTGPGNFWRPLYSGPIKLPLYRPNLGKSKKSPILHTKITLFITSTLPTHRALPKCKHGQSAPGGSAMGFGALRPEGRMFESPSSRYVEPLGKSFTNTCLQCLGVLTPTEYQCCSRE